MAPPSVPFSFLVWAFFDPVLMAVALWFGFHASQYGKVIVAIIAAMTASILVGWLMGAFKIPWFAPIGPDHPSLLPVRMLSSLFWSTTAYICAVLWKRLTGK